MKPELVYHILFFLKKYSFQGVQSPFGERQMKLLLPYIFLIQEIMKKPVLDLKKQKNRIVVQNMICWHILLPYHYRIEYTLAHRNTCLQKRKAYTSQLIK